MVFFAACTTPSDDPGEDITQIEVTNIPSSLSDLGGDKIPYKIYVQLANDTDYQKGHVAQGRKLINGANKMTIDLVKSDKPWTGRAKYISVVIAPRHPSDYRACSYHSFSIGTNAKIKSFNWTSYVADLKANTGFDAAIQQLYNDIIKNDPDLQ
jgi:hypothetical protein